MLHEAGGGGEGHVWGDGGDDDEFDVAGLELGFFEGALGGFGGEVVARLSDAAFEWLDAPLKRVAYPDRPVPFAKPLERELLPGKDEVVAAVRELVDY